MRHSIFKERKKNCNFIRVRVFFSQIRLQVFLDLFRIRWYFFHEDRIRLISRNKSHNVYCFKYVLAIELLVYRWYWLTYSNTHALIGGQILTILKIARQRLETWDDIWWPRSSDSFYIVTYNVKWVTTSWTHSIKRVIFKSISLLKRVPPYPSVIRKINFTYLNKNKDNEYLLRNLFSWLCFFFGIKYL